MNTLVINKIIQSIKPGTCVGAIISEYSNEYIKLRLEFDGQGSLNHFVGELSLGKIRTPYMVHASDPIIEFTVELNSPQEINGSVLSLTTALLNAFNEANIPFKAPLNKQAMKHALIAAGYVEKGHYADYLKSRLPAMKLSDKESAAFDEIIHVLKDYYDLSDYRGYLLSDLPVPDFNSGNYNERDRSNLRSPLHRQLNALQSLLARIPNIDVTCMVNEFMDDINYLLAHTHHGGLLPTGESVLRSISNHLKIDKRHHELLSAFTDKAIDISWCFKQMSYNLATRGHIVNDVYIVVDLRHCQQIEFRYIETEEYDVPDYIACTLMVDNNISIMALGDLHENLFFALLGLENMAASFPNIAPPSRDSILVSTE